MATSDRYISPVFQATNSSGQVLASAKLFFYDAGTTTPKSTFSDKELTSANTNPVIADGGGFWSDIFLEPGDYKVTLKTAADVEIWTRDYIKGGLPSAVNDALSKTTLLLARQAMGGNASINYATDYYTGVNGVSDVPTDNWTTLQAAVSAAATQNVPLYIPPSKPYTGADFWLFDANGTSPLQIQASMKIWGDGPQDSKMNFAAGTQGFQLDSGVTGASFVTFEGLHIRGSDDEATSDHIGINFEKGNYLDINNCLLEDWTDCLLLDARNAGLQSVHSTDLFTLQNKEVNENNNFPRRGIRTLGNVQASRFVNTTTYGEVNNSSYGFDIPENNANATPGTAVPNTDIGQNNGGQWDGSLRYYGIANPLSTNGGAPDGRQLSRPGSIRAYYRRTRLELTITAGTKANPCVLTSSGNHGMATGDVVYVEGTGLESAEGVFTVTKVSDTTFSIGSDTSSDTGTFASGGTATRNGDASPTLVAQTTGTPNVDRRTDYNLRVFDTNTTLSTGAIIDPADDIRSAGTLPVATYAVVLDFGGAVNEGDEFFIIWADGQGTTGVDLEGGSGNSFTNLQVGGFQTLVKCAATDWEIDIDYMQLAEVGLQITSASDGFIRANVRHGNNTVRDPVSRSAAVGVVELYSGATEYWQHVARESGSHIVLPSATAEPITFGSSLTVSAATNAAAPKPSRIETSTAHGLVTGDRVYVGGVDGTPPAGFNGWWTVDRNTSTRLYLGGGAGTGGGSYVSGGVVIPVANTLAIMNNDYIGPREAMCQLDLGLTRGGTGDISATVIISRSFEGNDRGSDGFNPGNFTVLASQQIKLYQGSATEVRMPFTLRVIDTTSGNFVDGSESAAYQVSITTDANTTATVYGGATNPSWIGCRRSNVP
jgi:hypothetical protein